MSSSVAYAFALGLVGLLNPCGFPLFPAYLSLFAGGNSGNWTARVGRGLRAGGCLTLGFVIVFGVLGLLASAALSVVIQVVPWIMLAVSLVLLAVGVLSVLGRALRLRPFGLHFAAGSGAFAMVGFGAAYAAGSLSCSLPLFLAAVSGALVGSLRLAGLEVFVAYAIGMGLFATGAATAVAFVGAGTVRALRGATRALPRLAGAICALSGLYLFAYWLQELFAPATRVPLLAAVQAVQGAIADWLDQEAVPVAAALGLLVVTGFTALALAAQKETQQ